MTRWPDWWTERLRRIGPLPVIAVGGLGGIAAEASVHSLEQISRWGPDLLVGMVFVTAGAATLRRPPVSALLLATAASWWMGTVASPLLHLHRGSLVHLVLAYPAGWPASIPVRLAIISGYVVALVPTVWADDTTAATLALALVAAVAWQRRHDRRRRQGRLAITAAVLLAIAVAGGALVRAVGPVQVIRPVLLAYHVLLVIIAAILVGGLRGPPAALVTDLVVELGRTRSDALRDALARALDDPGLVVGYPAATGGYTDAVGTPVRMPAPGDDRVTTAVDEGGQTVAVLVHDLAVLADPTLARAVAQATRLSVANARLVVASREQLAELEASRLRLVRAGDEERRNLEGRLRDGVQVLLSEAADRLASASVDGKAAEHRDRAAGHLAAVQEDLHRLAVGLHPRILNEGLGPALEDLTAEHQPPVELVVDLDLTELAPSLATTSYYVCAEALVNASKHARATRVSLQLRSRDGVLAIQVFDDGIGGADVLGGTGLQGIFDRVAADAGSMSIDSPPGRGTRLDVELPMNPQS